MKLEIEIKSEEAKLKLKELREQGISITALVNLWLLDLDV